MLHNIDGPSASEVKGGNDDLATELALQTHPVVLFLKEEIERSSALLRELATVFTAEICALSEASNLHMAKLGVIRLSEALQSEDRIQQRLWDIGLALEMLEGAIDPSNVADRRQLSSMIIKRLKLNEMQVALAIKANVHGEIIGSRAAHEPSVGDIDLF
jgi:hypothetical protein